MNADLCNIEPSAKSLAYLNGRVKRCVDIFGSLIGIIFCTPTFLVAAFVVKIVDKIPVLFSQERIGLHGQPFVIVKLRTLIVEEKHIVNPETIYKKPNYVTTRTGKFWRITSIDEIIQFFLVLKGEMSLIGHRSIPLYYLPYLAQMDDMDPTKIKHYLSVVYQYKPGMSSLSSVNGRGDLTLQQKFRYDLIYARDANFIYDIKLLLQTLYAVISQHGAKQLLSIKPPNSDFKFSLLPGRVQSRPLLSTDAKRWALGKTYLREKSHHEQNTNLYY